MAGPFQRADHTYVTSDAGHVWPCWGRGAGGSSVCGGSGDLSVADCLSQPNSQAGIRYGLTGVCHQTANRILAPATIEVANAGGARQSYALYGVFGIGSWPELQRCASGLPGMKPLQPKSGLLSKLLAAWNRLTRADQVFTLQELEATQRRAELLAMFDHYLGEDYDPEKRERVVQVYLAFQGEQRSLVGALDRHRLSPEQYLAAFSALEGRTFQASRMILGDGDFERLFGSETPVATLIDPDVFLQQHGRTSGAY